MIRYLEKPPKIAILNQNYPQNNTFICIRYIATRKQIKLLQQHNQVTIKQDQNYYYTYFFKHQEFERTITENLNLPTRQSVNLEVEYFNLNDV